MQDKLDVTLHKHTLSKSIPKSAKTKRLPGNSDRVSQFFSEIPKEVILELYEYCKRDYDMFGYPPPKALIDVNKKDELVIRKYKQKQEETERNTKKQKETERNTKKQKETERNKKKQKERERNNN